MLEKICDYYTRSEPASPIPLLLRRAERLLNKDFWGIIMDMAPDSAGILQTITGSPPPEQTSGLIRRPTDSLLARMICCGGISF